MRSIIISLLCFTFNLVTAADLLVADFEVNNSNYTLPYSGIISTADFFIRSYDNDLLAVHEVFINEQGTYYLVGRDIDEVTGSAQYIPVQIVLNDINVSSYSNLQVKLSVAAPSGLRYESYLTFNEDYIMGQYSYDGTNWTKFAQFTGQHVTNSDYMSEDTDLNGVGDGTVLSDTFQEFTYNIPDGGTTLKVRFLIYGNSGTEVMAVDNIKVSGTLTGPPGVPQNLITVSVTSSEANISWDAVTGATYYRIYRSSDPYSGFVQINTSTTTNYQDMDVAVGNKYFYYVTADNAK